MILAHGADGIIVSNTTLSRAGLTDAAFAKEAGGLSGRPLFARATRMLARVYRLTEGKLPLIGVGGIDSGETALAKIEAGASLRPALYRARVRRACADRPHQAGAGRGDGEGRQRQPRAADRAPRGRVVGTGDRAMTRHHLPQSALLEIARDARSFSRRAGLTPEVVEYLKTPPSAAELKAILRKLGLEAARPLAHGRAALCRTRPQDRASSTTMADRVDGRKPDPDRAADRRRGRQGRDRQAARKGPCDPSSS